MSLIVASIAASLTLFACGSDREAQGGIPDNAANPESESSGTAANRQAKSNPEPAATAVAQAPDTAKDPWAVEPLPEKQTTTFGSDGKLEDEGPRVARKIDPRPGTAGHVFTNKDLHRYRPLKEAFGLDDKPGAQATLADQRDSEASDAENPKKPEGEKSMTPEELQAEITKAEQELEYLRSRGPSLHNPFLPRVAPNDQDTEAEKGMDNVQRLAHVDARIAETEAKIDKLRQKLEALSQPPPPNQ